jgi:hypothetical protein
MADSKRLIDWAMEHRGDLNLRVTRLTWPESFGLSIRDTRVEITFDKKVFIGAVIAETFEISLA